MARDDLRSAAAGQLTRWERLLTDELMRLFDRQEGVVLARLQGTKARKNTRHWMPPGEEKVDPSYVLDQTRWTLDASGSVEPVVRRMYADTYDQLASQVAGPPPPPDGSAPPAQPVAQPAQPPQGAPVSPPVPSTPDGGGVAGPLLAAALVAALITGGNDTHPVLGALGHTVVAFRDRKQAALEAAVQRKLVQIAQMAQAVNSTVQAVIAAQEAENMGMPDIVKAVRKVYEEQKKDWAKKIADSVVPAAVNEASQIAVGDVADALTATAQAGTTPPAISKQWLSSHDDRVRPTHAHADGQVVPLAARFRLGGIPAQPVVSWAMFPGDPELPANERINCRCTMLFSRPKVAVLKPAADEEKAFNPTQARAHDGKWAKIPGLGALAPDADGRDTDVKVFGMRFRRAHAERPDVRAVKGWNGWGDVPLQPVPTKGLLATEGRLDSRPINKVLRGAPLRSGYDPQILRTDDGDFVIDGHHRVAMHAGLGHETMPAAVLDVRSSAGGFAGAQVRLQKQREQAAAARAAAAKADADKIADRMVSAAEAADPKITPAIMQVVSSHGGHMDGLENRIKTRESTARKILVRAHTKQTSPSSAAAGISDVLRYTAVLPTGNYTEGVQGTLDALRAAGFSPTMSNNYWAKGDAYSGLNVLLSGKGQSIEVQFHTPESMEAKALAHHDYEISRDDTAPLANRMAAWNRMIPLWDDVPQPEQWWTLGSLFVYDPPGKGRGHYISKWEAQGLPEPPPPPSRPAAAPLAVPFNDGHGWQSHWKPLPSLKPPWTGKFPWSKG